MSIFLGGVKMKETLVQNIFFKDDKFKILIGDFSPSNVDTAIHEELEIKLQISGTSMVCVDEEFFILEKGDVLVVNPLQLHSSVVNEAKSDSKYLLIIVDLGFCDDSFFANDLNLRKKLLADGVRFNNVFKSNLKLASIIQQVFVEFQREGKYHEILIKCLLYELLVYLFRESEKNVVKTERKKQSIDVVFPAIKYMLENFSQQITLDELSDLCGLSKYYFSRVFRKVMGQTPMNYILSLRINYAKMLLKSANCNLDVVASKCGFVDISYFSNVFKKAVGVPPSVYREKT